MKVVVLACVEGVCVETAAEPTAREASDAIAQAAQTILRRAATKVVSQP